MITTIALISSTLQFINSIEYLKYEGINSDKVLFIITTADKLTIDQIRRYSLEFKIRRLDFFFETKRTSLFKAIKLFFLICRYRRADGILGNINNGWARFKAQISKNNTIVDDGAVTVSILEKRRVSNYMLSSLKRWPSINFFQWLINLGRIKICKPLKFYTIFHDLPGGKHDLIEPNYLKILSKQDNLQSKSVIKLDHEVWFIGSPLVRYNIVCWEEYLETLRKIEQWADNKNLKFRYFAHKAESYDLKFPFKMIRLDEPIEVKYLKSINKPRYIISYYSSSLFFIAKLNSKSKILYCEPDFNKVTEDHYDSLKIIYEYIVQHKELAKLSL